MSTTEFTDLLLVNSNSLKPLAIRLTNDKEEAKDLTRKHFTKLTQIEKNIMSVPISRPGCIQLCVIFLSMTTGRVRSTKQFLTQMQTTS